jgi:NAD(P)-dependent dehydrogenase (short-subunit alcohol dehydrogenase family)
MSFEGTKVLITGATSGIGEATAERFARLGAQVIVTGRDETRGAQVVSRIKQAGGHTRFIAADLGRSGDILRLAGEASDVDVLVNNAGGSPFVVTAETDVDIAHSILEVNLVAPFLLTGQLAPKMGERGHGAIINISSHAAGHGIPFLAAYGAAKAGIDVLTKTWALEYGPHGVRTNCVSPGAVRTPPADALGEMFDQMANATPLGRAAQAHEIAAAVTFLASEDASYVNGAIIPVDGGMGAN